MTWDDQARFYPIVDTDLCRSRGIDPLDVAATCLSAGVRILQLRVKAAPSGAFLATAAAVVTSARSRGTHVIVNDRADVARLAGADGVHVGQDDLPPDLVRRVYPDAVIGLSTHDERQIDDAMASAADYVAVGPIYGTTTKETGYSARGLRLIEYAADRGKPVVAIGGITLERATDALAAGAAAVVVISDLFATGDLDARVRQYLRRCNQ